MMLGLFAGKEGAMGEKLSWMIVGIVTVFLFSGCASLKCLDGSCERQIQVLTITNDEMKKELTRLETEVKEKDKEVQSTKEEIAKLQSEKAALTAQVKDLQEYIERVKRMKRLRSRPKRSQKRKGCRNRKPRNRTRRPRQTPEDQGPVGRRKAGRLRERWRDG